MSFPILRKIAIKATLEKSYKTITHLLCLWHIIQSFSKYFNFLHAMNHGALKNQNFRASVYRESRRVPKNLWDNSKLINWEKILERISLFGRNVEN